MSVVFEIYDSAFALRSERSLEQQIDELLERSRAQWRKHQATPRWHLWRRYRTRYQAQRLACLGNLLRLCRDV